MQDICHPDAAVLEDPYGVLHDDGTGSNVNCAVQDCSQTGAGATQNGYEDNLDCAVRIRAPRGGTVNLHFASMNLEGPESGICSRANPVRLQEAFDEHMRDSKLSNLHCIAVVLLVCRIVQDGATAIRTLMKTALIMSRSVTATMKTHRSSRV